MERMFFFWTPVRQPTCYCFTAMNIYNLTDANLSRKTLRCPVSNSEMLHDLLPSHSKTSFFSWFYICPRGHQSPKAWTKQPKSDGQVYFPKYFDKNAKSLAMTSARCWAQNTCWFAWKSGCVDWYTSQVFSCCFFLDLTRDIVRQIGDMTSNLTLINLPNKTSSFFLQMCLIFYFQL